MRWRRASAASTDDATRSTAALSRWEQAGRYVPAAVIGVLSWATLATDTYRPASRVELAVDAVLGVACLVALVRRRRHPVAVAIGITAATAFSEAATGAWMVSVVSLATRRRWLPSLAVVAVSVAASLSVGWTEPPRSDPVMVDEPWWSGSVYVVLVNALLIAVGYYVGARRDLLASLRERAETAEREQALRVVQARAAERATIAREMHDVLAHRISLVAMHAGALAYRTDLSEQQRTAEAQLIQENAHRALSDLRDVLGVLRAHAAARADAEAPARGPEPPQPTLHDLRDLVAETQAAGEDVDLLLDVPEPGKVPGTVGRHAYRIVQECLTNARKHAPGARVTVRVGGRPGDALTVEVTNPLVTSAQADDPPPGSGVGLLGLAERAELTGGHIVHGPTIDGRYAVRVRLPWSDERGGS